MNGDGHQGMEDHPFSRISVTLLDERRKFLRRTQTDADGVYLFCDLPVGDYFVKLEVPNLFRVSADPDGDLEGIAAVRVARESPADLNYDVLDIDFGLERKY